MYRLFNFVPKHPFVSLGSFGILGGSFVAWRSTANGGHDACDAHVTALQEKFERTYAGLPTLEFAEGTRPVRVPQLLSTDEVSAIHRFAATSAVCSKAGVNHRDDKGKYTEAEPGATTWSTIYLHTDRLFQDQFPELYHRVCTTVRDVDRREGWGLLEWETTGHSLNDPKNRTAQARVVEYHQVERNGALLDRNHRDMGSLITLDIMMSNPSDFTGGQFTTFTRDGETLNEHPFGLGDAMVFVSHKRHFVQPVRAGRRCVLIFEFWDGEERVCPHRCLQHWGKCQYNHWFAFVERIIKSLSAD